MKIGRYILLVLLAAIIVVGVVRLRAEPRQFFASTQTLSRQDLLNRGTSYIKKEMPDSALAYFAMASRDYENPNLSPLDQEICATALGNAGYVYIFFYQDYPAAYSVLLSSNDLADRQGLSRIRAINDINIGNIHSIYKDFPAAMRVYREAFDSARVHKQRDLMMYAFVDLADICLNEQGKVEPMLPQIEAFGRDSVPKGHPITPYTRCLYQGLKRVRSNPREAVRWIQKAKDSVGSLHLSERYAYNADFMVSRLLDRMGEPDRAVDHLRKILEDSAIVSNRDVEAMAYQRISESFRLAGRPDSANKYRIKYLEISDSLFATQKMTAVKDLAASHERNKFMTELTRISNTVSFQRRLIVSITIGVLLVLGLLIWIFIKNRQLKRSNEDLYSRNRELLALHDSTLLAPIPERLEPTGQDDSSSTEAMEERASHSQELPPVSGKAETTTQEENFQEGDSRGKLAVDSAFMVELRRRILEVMGSDEIFSPDFNSTRLATLCETNTRYISAALTETEAGNFPALLAQFRVREAMRRLDDLDGPYSSLTLEAIGESVGFKTRSTFSTTFKKVTGLTPKQYRQIGIEKRQTA